MQKNQLTEDRVDRVGQISKGLVYVIDDQELCRFLLHSQMENAGYEAKSYGSPETFLDEFRVDQVGCIIVDYRMPSMSGVELVQKVRQRGCQVPFIVVTGYGTVSLAVEIMQMGAISVLEKPYRQEQLLDCVESAMTRDIQERQIAEQSAILSQRLERLTLREMDVLQLANKGRLTKQISKDLNISAKTVEVHRSNIIKKMEVESMLQLMQLLANTRTDLGTSSF